jgi:hypothetical protein
MTDKELERRRQRCKFALVYWEESAWGEAEYCIEYKTTLKQWTEGKDYKMVCDHQPRHVLEGMLKLLKEE